MSFRNSTLLALGLVVVGIALPFTGLYTQFLMKCIALALFAVAFNFFTGNVGLLSIGHAAFFGVGAYAAGYATKSWGFSPEVSLLLGAVVGALIGLVMGAMAIRRQGIYFAMITLALAQMVYFICVQAPFTGAEDGLQRIPRRPLFGLIDVSTDIALYVFLLAIFALAVWALQRLMEAPYGQVLLAIRDNEPRAISLGYDVQSYKLSAFTISAGIAGLAGGMKALTLSFAGLPDVHWTQSGSVILMCLLGGLGTPLGPIVGAILIVTLESKLSGLGAVQVGGWSVDLSTKVPVIIGLIFMSCVLLFRRGVVGEITAWWENARIKRQHKIEKADALS